MFLVTSDNRETWRSALESVRVFEGVRETPVRLQRLYIAVQTGTDLWEYERLHGGVLHVTGLLRKIHCITTRGDTRIIVRASSP